MISRPIWAAEKQAAVNILTSCWSPPAVGLPVFALEGPFLTQTHTHTRTHTTLYSNISCSHSAPWILTCSAAAVIKQNFFHQCKSKIKLWLCWIEALHELAHMIQKKQVIFMLLQHRCSYCTWPLGVSVTPGSAEKLYGFCLDWFIRLEVFFLLFLFQKSTWWSCDVWCPLFLFTLLSHFTHFTHFVDQWSLQKKTPPSGPWCEPLSPESRCRRFTGNLQQSCSLLASPGSRVAAALCTPSARWNGMLHLSLSFDCVTWNVALNIIDNRGQSVLFLLSFTKHGEMDRAQ